MGPTDLLVIAVAAVYDPVGAPDNLSADTFRDFIRPPLTIYPPVDSFRVVSNRDQIEILLSPSRTEVRELSGDADRAKIKLPEVLAGVLGILREPVFRSYEIDFYLESYAKENEDVGAWLGRHFLTTGIHDLGAGVSCQNVTVSYDRNAWTQTIDLEVVPESRVIVRSYSHRDIDELPDKNDAQQDVQSQHEYLSELLRKVGFNSYDISDC